MDNIFYCLIVGSRSFNDYKCLKFNCDSLLINQQNICVVSGGARGADSFAEQYAKEKGYDLKIFKANWNLFGKQAGFIRNEEMHKYISQFNKRGVIAFWDGQSKGTEQNFQLSKKYNNEIKIIKYKENTR